MRGSVHFALVHQGCAQHRDESEAYARAFLVPPGVTGEDAVLIRRAAAVRGVRVRSSSSFAPAEGCWGRETGDDGRAPNSGGSCRSGLGVVGPSLLSGEAGGVALSGGG